MKKNTLFLLTFFLWNSVLFAQKPLNNGVYSIQSLNSGRVVAVEGGNTNNGANVLQYDNINQSDIYWKFVEESPNNFVIINKKSNRILAVGAASKDNGGNVLIWDNINQADRLWRVEAQGSSFYLVNVNSGKVLDVSNVSKENNANIHQWEKTGGTNQLWNFVPEPVSDPNTTVYTISAKELFDELAAKGYPTERSSDGTKNSEMIYRQVEGGDIKLYAKPMAGGDAFSVRNLFEGVTLSNGFTYEDFEFRTLGNIKDKRNATYEVREKPQRGSANLQHKIYIKAKYMGMTADDRAIFYLQNFKIRGKKGQDWKTAFVSKIPVQTNNNNNTSSNTSNGTMSQADFKRIMLEKHNAERALLGIAPVTWSDEITAYAQAWANELVKRGCKMEHRPRDNGQWSQIYGENIYSGNGGEWGNPTNSVNSWSSEKKDYDHNKQECKGNWSICGHYTQVIWEKSTQIGCAFAVCADGTVIVVGNYNPPGNWNGEKPYIKR